jgi:Rho termination factor, N-terminal domain
MAGLPAADNPGQLEGLAQASAAKQVWEVVPMPTTSNQPPPRNRRSPRRLLVGPVRPGRGLGRAAVKLMRSIGRIAAPGSKQTRPSGKDGPRRLRTLRHRSVAAIRQSVTTARGLPTQAARQIRKRAGRRGDLAGAVRPTAATAQDQVEAKPAKTRARTRRTRQRRAASPQAKPAQVRHTQDLEHHTVRELRRQARQAGIKRSSSMTKAQLIKTLQPSPPGGQAQAGPYEERTVEELQERAAQLGIKGRTSMTKEQLIKALRDHR